MRSARIILSPYAFPPGDFLAEPQEATQLNSEWLRQYGAKRLSPIKQTLFQAILRFAEKRFNSNTFMSFLTRTRDQRKVVCNTILRAYAQDDDGFIDTVCRACASIKDKKSELRKILQNCLNTLPAATPPAESKIETELLKPGLPIAHQVKESTKPRFFNTPLGRSLLFGGTMSTFAFCSSIRDGNYLSAPAHAVTSLISNTGLSLLALITSDNHKLITAASITGITMLFYLCEDGPATAISEGLIAGGLSLLSTLPYRKP